MLSCGEYKLPLVWGGGKKINNLQQSCPDLPMQDMNRGFLDQPNQENGHCVIVDSLFKMKKEMHHNTHKPLLQMRLHIHRPIRIYSNQFLSLKLFNDQNIRTSMEKSCLIQWAVYMDILFWGSNGTKTHHEKTINQFKCLGNILLGNT